MTDKGAKRGRLECTVGLGKQGCDFAWLKSLTRCDLRNDGQIFLFQNISLYSLKCLLHFVTIISI